MGRDAGHIALYAGIGGGADVILIPEIPYAMDRVAGQILNLRERGRNHALVVVAEAARETGGGAPGEASHGGVGHRLGQRIAETTGAETRVTVLGHVQRGGVPDAPDRITASAFGVRAVDLLANGASARMVAWQHRQVVDVPLAEVTSRVRLVGLDDTLVRTARGLGICLGD